MGFRIKEIQERKRKKLERIEEDMIKKEAVRYGGSREDPIESEHAFIYKIKAIRSHFKDHDSLNEATEDFVTNLKGVQSLDGLPISKVDPSLLLDLL